jgi:hypothetical protein
MNRMSGRKPESLDGIREMWPVSWREGRQGRRHGSCSKVLVDAWHHIAGFCPLTIICGHPAGHEDRPIGHHRTNGCPRSPCERTGQTRNPRGSPESHRNDWRFPLECMMNSPLIFRLQLCDLGANHSTRFAPFFMRSTVATSLPAKFVYGIVRHAKLFILIRCYRYRGSFCISET